MIKYYKFLLLNLFSSILNNQLLFNQSKPDVFREVRKSVVLIKTFDMPNIGGSSGYHQGSGYIADKSGLVITNHHIVDDVYLIVVFVQNESKIDTMPAYVLWKDKELDLAVIKIDEGNYTPAKIADINEVHQGDEILVLGFPGASTKSDEIKVTWGIISSDTKDSTLQTTATINPGNSGGPAVNMQGKVVGTVFSKYIGFSVEGTGFLRSIVYTNEALNKAKENLKDIKEYSGAEVKSAYDKMCMAEIVYSEVDNQKTANERLEIINNAIGRAKSSLQDDANYTEGLYFISAYYLRQAITYCELFNQAEANRSLKLFTENYKKAKKYTSLSEHIDYTDRMDKRVEKLIESEEIDCDFWRKVIDYKVDYEKEREARFEEFFNYLNYGETPDRLKWALEDEEDGYTISSSSTSTRKKNINSLPLLEKPMMVTFYNYFTAISERFDYLASQVQLIEFGIEYLDNLSFYAGFYPRIEDYYRKDNSVGFHLGLIISGLRCNFLITDVENRIAPKFALGYYIDYPHAKKNKNKFWYGFDLLYYDVPDPQFGGEIVFAEKLGYRGQVGSYILNKFNLSTSLTLLKETVQLGIGLGYNW